MKNGFQFVDSKEILLDKINSAVIMGDVGCTLFTEESKNIVAKLLKTKTDLFIILGDLVRYGRDEEFLDLINFCNKRASAPIFCICGNHDTLGYSKYFGLASYILIQDKYCIISIDNSSANFLNENIIFLEKMLIKHFDKNFLVLFHIPPPNDINTNHIKNEQWQTIKTVLDKHKGRIRCIFSGHIHIFRKFYLDNYRIIITGGGGATLHDFEKDILKTHHAIKLNLADKSKIGFNIILAK